MSTSSEIIPSVVMSDTTVSEYGLPVTETLSETSLEKMKRLRAFIDSNPKFDEFRKGQSSTPTTLMKAQVDRLDEIKRRDAIMRRLHGLNDTDSLEKDEFRDQFFSLVSATSDLTGANLQTESNSVTSSFSPSSTTTLPPVASTPDNADVTNTPVSIDAITHHRGDSSSGRVPTVLPVEAQAEAASEARLASQLNEIGVDPQQKNQSHEKSSSSNLDNDDNIPSEAFTSWDSEEHKFFIANICHRDQRPICKVAGLRILPAFSTREETIQNGCEIHTTIKNASVWMFELHKPFPLCRTTAQQMDPTYCEDKVTLIKGLYENHSREVDKDFETNLKEKKTGAQKMSLKHKLEKKKAESHSHPRTKLQDARLVERRKNSNIPEADKKFPRTLEHRLQRFAAIRVFQDIDPQALKNLKDDEPVIIVDGFFETELGARHWLEKVAATYVKTENMHVVDMYEWLHPSTVDESKIVDKYRDVEQNTIMKQKKAEKDRVMNFNVWSRSREELKALEAKHRKTEPDTTTSDVASSSSSATNAPTNAPVSQ